VIERVQDQRALDTTTRRRLILADFPLNVDRARLTQYISSWMLEPQVDTELVAHFNDVLRAETRADV
jgi:hypothetical protein